MIHLTDKFEEALKKACENTGGNYQNNECQYEDKTVPEQEFKQELQKEIKKEIDKSITSSTKIKNKDETEIE